MYINISLLIVINMVTSPICKWRPHLLDAAHAVRTSMSHLMLLNGCLLMLHRSLGLSRYPCKGLSIFFIEVTTSIT
jgi:hypothetical protein